MERLALLAPADREPEIAYELSRGNLPAFLRQFKTIHARWRDPHGNEHAAHGGGLRRRPSANLPGSRGPPPQS